MEADHAARWDQIKTYKQLKQAQKDLSWVFRSDPTSPDLTREMEDMYIQAVAMFSGFLSRVLEAVVQYFEPYAEGRNLLWKKQNLDRFATDIVTKKQPFMGIEEKDGILSFTNFPSGKAECILTFQPFKIDIEKPIKTELLREMSTHYYLEIEEGE